MSFLKSLMATIVINTKCNQQCVYCPPMGESFSGEAGELSFRKGEKIINQLVDAGVRVLRLSGGEPTLHSEISKYLDLSRELLQKDCVVHLNTNGVLLDRLRHQFDSSYFSSARISFDSLNKKKYAQITGTNTLDRVLKNIETAAKKGIPADLIMVIMQHNIDEIFEVIDFCVRTGIGLKLSDLEPHEFDDQQYFQNQYASLSEIHARLEETSDCNPPDI